MLAKVNIYTDGAARGNPRSQGYGTIIEYVDSKGVLHVREYSGGYRKTTNNRMELMAAIVGLEVYRAAATCTPTRSIWSRLLPSTGWMNG